MRGAAAAAGSTTERVWEADFSGIGSRTVTTVPRSLDSISTTPPSWRSLSLIPRILTPGVPDDASSSCFSLEIPLPVSSITTTT